MKSRISKGCADIFSSTVSIIFIEAIDCFSEEPSLVLAFLFHFGSAVSPGGDCPPVESGRNFFVELFSSSPAPSPARQHTYMLLLPHF